MFDLGKWRTTELSDPSNSSHFNSEPVKEFMLSPSVELCEKHGALLDIFDPTVELPEVFKCLNLRASKPLFNPKAVGMKFKRYKLDNSKLTTF